VKGSLPGRLVIEDGKIEIEWFVGHEARFTEPFFERTLVRLARLPGNARSERPRTPADALRDVAPGVPPTAFIFHVSRCGSTLLAQLLAAVPAHIVIAEAPVIDDILRAPRRDARVSDEDRIAWLRGAVAALGQQAGAKRLFVKFDCWSLFELPLIRRAFPGVPCLFIYRHPLEVLVSLMRQTSLALVRDTVTPAQMGLTETERDSLPPEEHAAAILGAFFREARARRGELWPVAYEQLPAFAWESMPGFAPTAEERTAMQGASLRNAKQPAVPFAPDTLEKRQEATPALLAASSRWAEPHYARWLAVV
jgi:hypothetical protein